MNAPPCTLAGSTWIHKCQPFFQPPKSSDSKSSLENTRNSQLHRIVPREVLDKSHMEGGREGGWVGGGGKARRAPLRSFSGTYVHGEFSGGGGADVDVVHAQRSPIGSRRQHHALPVVPSHGRRLVAQHLLHHLRLFLSTSPANTPGQHFSPCKEEKHSPSPIAIIPAWFGAVPQ